MWVIAIEPTTFAVHMDTPHHLQSSQPQSRLMYSPSAVTSTAAATPPATRKTRKSPRSMRDVTCAPSQTLCRYANKKCANPRAVKRTGGLHTFCAMHRENANRNQRRLDLRKRLQKQALQSSALLDRRQSLHTARARSLPQSHSQSRLQSQPELPLPQPFSLQADSAPLALELALPHNNHNNSDLLYEPLATPTPLRDEDVATLITLFASAEQQRQLDPLWFADVSSPREPLYSLLSDTNARN